jgi:hypothetical protein
MVIEYRHPIRERRESNINQAQEGIEGWETLAHTRYKLRLIIDTGAPIILLISAYSSRN